jgi:proteasome lid subunit RPN8/RPN11
MILVHNHPSGDPEPSEDDRRVTKMLAKCGELMGVKVIDHVIIGDGVFTSMRARDSGIFDTMSYTAKLVSEKKHSELSHER